MKEDFDTGEFGKPDMSKEEVAIPVIEEQLNVSKKMVETGNVKISKSVKEEEVTVNISLEAEEVDVERVAINQYVENLPPAVSYEGGTMVIPILKEVLVKKVILVEEIRITKRKAEHVKTEKVILRKEDVTIEKNKTS